MLTVLRNRVYLGEVFYRDRWHRRDPPPRSVDETVRRRRASCCPRRRPHPPHRARSVYLLAGLIFCTRCGKRYQGTVRAEPVHLPLLHLLHPAPVRRATCPAERLPADQVEHAVLDSLLATLARTDLIDAALADAHDEHAADRAAHTTELAAVETELVKTEAAIDRYLTAFENQTMPEATCAPRIRALSDKATELKARRDELGLLLDDTPTAPPRPSPATSTPCATASATTDGDALPETVQALLQAMTERIDVTSRADITPTFRVPITDTTEPSTAAVTDGEVRTLPGTVPPAGFERARCPRQDSNVRGAPPARHVQHLHELPC